MTIVDALANLVDPSAPDEWYVTDGATSVGPVTRELLARGIAAGKVPADAFVRHSSWDAWRTPADLKEHEPKFDARRSFRVLPAVKIPRPEARQQLDSADIIEVVTPDEPAPRLSPEGSFASAADLAEALLILLTLVVEECGAEGALIHRTTEDVAVVVCSHGPRMFESLGARMQRSDPIFYAAKHGHTIITEHVPGVGGRAMKARLTRLGAPIEAAFMVPMRLDGRLLAIVEAGRAKPFRAHDVVRAEILVDQLIDVVARSSWSREWAPPAPRPGG
ncbi:MAG: GAF domain-containing protein [Polyangiaceae bacterium]